MKTRIENIIMDLEEDLLNAEKLKDYAAVNQLKFRIIQLSERVLDI